MGVFCTSICMSICTSICMSILHIYLHGYFARVFGFQLMVDNWLLGHLGPSAPWWASNFSCYLFYSWFLPENIEQAKGIECSQYKTTAAIFSSRLPICPVCFHLVMPMHVLSPCYARYEHTRGRKGYVTYYLAFYVRLQVQILPYYMRLRVQNMPGCHLRKYR